MWAEQRMMFMHGVAIHMELAARRVKNVYGISELMQQWRWLTLHMKRWKYNTTILSPLAWLTSDAMSSTITNICIFVSEVTFALCRLPTERRSPSKISDARTQIGGGASANHRIYERIAIKSRLTIIISFVCDSDAYAELCSPYCLCLFKLTGKRLNLVFM